MSDRDIFKENINRLMEQTGCTQQKLADFVGVERTTVSAWMRGKSYPRADVMERISYFFGITLSDLIMPKNERDLELRLIRAWRTAEPMYKQIALELLEAHHIMTDYEKAAVVLEREGFFDDKRTKAWKAKKKVYDALDELNTIENEQNNR